MRGPSEIKPASLDPICSLSTTSERASDFKPFAPASTLAQKAEPAGSHQAAGAG